MNRALEKGNKASEFGLGSEVRCNPDDLRVELAGYWSRLLVRVKEQSEVVDGKKVSEEFRATRNRIASNRVFLGIESSSF